MHMTRTNKRLMGIIGGVLVITSVFLISAPQGETFPKTFTVAENESLRSVSERLEEEKLIRFPVLFRSLISFFDLDRQIQLGVYKFENRMSVLGVVSHFKRGPYTPLLSVTIPEGSTTEEVAQLVVNKLPTISAQTFINLVRKQKLDGYLFPSTYELLPSFTEQKIIDIMTETFEREYGKLMAESVIPKTVRTRQDVVSLAAILEGEARAEEDMRMVSGILQARLAIGMRLQVDVVPSTYHQAGIPSVPVNNPGLTSMRAVFNPLSSPYLYYITGDDGTMYYAKTFEQHKANIRNHLR